MLLLAYPAQHRFGLPLGYNLEVFLILLGNGLCGYALARSLVRDPFVALAASLVAVVNPITVQDVGASGLRQVLLWDRVKDRLNKKATQLSLEEQQKLCIARLLPTKPQVLLMDEPCSALDPEATSAVEELIWELRGKYSILIVTHNMAQARRASDECVFMLLGKVIEHTATEQMFVAPEKKETSDYIEGRFG